MDDEHGDPCHPSITTEGEPKMNLSRKIKGAVALAAVLAASSAFADDGDYRPFTYEVTITNVTKGQVFSPPVLVTHSQDVALFAVGETALEELALVAEAGDGGPLAALASSLSQVGEAQATGAPIPPGASAVYTIGGTREFDVLSIVGMLVNTNDAFFALDSQALPKGRRGSRSYYAASYDAGSEGNNEDCAFIPGPACPGGSGNARSTGDAEGYVHIHNGVHGIADLAPAAYDWRNPVAKVTITRVR
jgi:hypothetical protein